MKFISLRSNIKEVLNAVQRASGENTNLPILKNTLIQVVGNKITFTATNLEIAITAEVSGKIIEDGTITIQTSILSNLISNLQSDRINFESKGGHLEIKTDNYTALLQGLPSEDFPATPTVEDRKHYLETKAVFLREAIQQAIIASQFSDLRPELNSLLIDFSLESLKVAASDGFRLAEKTVQKSAFTSKFTEPFRILVPIKTAQELARIFADDELVKIFYDQNQILVKTEKIELISRLNEGNFPDYSSLIPSSFVAEVTVNQDELLNAIKLAGVFSQKNNEMKLTIHTQKKALEVSSADQSLGENTYLIPAKIKGNAFEIFFNAKYLFDGVKAASGEDVFLGLQEEGNPALVKSFSDSSYFYILKPILKG